MRAWKLFHYKAQQGRVLIEMAIWTLPEPSVERPHGLKYRLHCGSIEQCIVRYDNETNKGDHRHYGKYEELYAFESVEMLISDFRKDCTCLAGWRWS